MQATPYSQMARQFLELWQKQMSAVMNDRDFIASMLEMVKGAGMPDAGKAAEFYAGFTPATAQSAVSPDALPERLDQLEYRVRMLEKRLAEREGGPKPKRAGGAAASGKRAGKGAAGRTAKRP